MGELRSGIGLEMSASCRRTPMMATTGSIWLGEIQAPSGRRRVGSMQGARFSQWLILRRTPGAGPRARRRSRSRPSRSRSCAGSMRCSRSSGPSTAGARKCACRSAAAHRPLAPILCYIGRCARRGNDLVSAIQLHSEALGELHSVPSGWARMLVQQCRRVWVADRPGESRGCFADPIAADSAPLLCSAVVPPR